MTTPRHLSLQIHKPGDETTTDGVEPFESELVPQQVRDVFISDPKAVSIGCLVGEHYIVYTRVPETEQS